MISTTKIWELDGNSWTVWDGDGHRSNFFRLFRWWWRAAFCWRGLHDVSNKWNDKVVWTGEVSWDIVLDVFACVFVILLGRNAKWAKVEDLGGTTMAAGLLNADGVLLNFLLGDPGALRDCLVRAGNSEVFCAEAVANPKKKSVWQWESQ